MRQTRMTVEELLEMIENHPDPDMISGCPGNHGCSCGPLPIGLLYNEIGEIATDLASAPEEIAKAEDILIKKLTEGNPRLKGFAYNFLILSREIGRLTDSKKLAALAAFEADPKNKSLTIHKNELIEVWRATHRRH